MVLCRGGLVSGRDVDESFTGLDLNSGLASLLRDSKCGIIAVIPQKRADYVQLSRLLCWMRATGECLFYKHHQLLDSTGDGDGLACSLYDCLRGVQCRYMPLNSRSHYSFFIAVFWHSVH